MLSFWKRLKILSFGKVLRQVVCKKKINNSRVTTGLKPTGANRLETDNGHVSKSREILFLKWAGTRRCACARACASLAKNVGRVYLLDFFLLYKIHYSK